MKAEVQLIISAQALMAIEHGTDEAGFREKFEPDFSFPDGSLHYSSEVACEEIRKFLTMSGLSRRVCTTIGKSSALYASPFRMSIVYPRTYERALGELCFGGGSRDTTTSEPHERINPVNVVVEFQKPPDALTQERYMQYLRFWARSVQDQGIAGEGPARLAAAEVAFSERWCWFEVDGMESGPHTLNWLILVHLNFGIDVWPVAFISFNPPRWADARIQLPLAQTQVTRSFSDILNGPVVLSSEIEVDEAPETYYQWNCGGLVGMQTPFPVEFSDDFEWEETEITIHFQSFISRRGMKTLREVVHSWLRLARWGGFGGEGIKGYDAPEFSDDCRSVHIRANFRGSEMEQCIRVLIGALDLLHRESIRIEKITFR